MSTAITEQAPGGQGADRCHNARRQVWVYAGDNWAARPPLPGNHPQAGSPPGFSLLCEASEEAAMSTPGVWRCADQASP
jgi:hypothetical protein